MILFFILLGCHLNGISSSIRLSENFYKEMIPTEAEYWIDHLDDKILLTEKQIMGSNQKIKKSTKSMYDLDHIDILDQKQIKNYIESYTIPKLPKYNGYLKITQKQVENILHNRNLENISTKLKKGIIVKRTNLKSFPTDIHFFYMKGDYGFDMLQETELTINTPVLVIHESKDKIWDFVISEIYMGWIKKDHLALCSSKDWNYFRNSRFGVVTDNAIQVFDTTLDMGVKLPYIMTFQNRKLVVIPRKGKNGFVQKKVIQLKVNQFHIGFLPYTKKNVIIQAFKYKGVDYSWGGLDKNVDCSSFVRNVYRTFGFEFPRNTLDQKDSIETIVPLKQKTINEKIKLIRNEDTSLLYKPGHVMIYIGKDSVIHASGLERKVVVSPLSETILEIDRMVIPFFDSSEK